MIFNHHRGALQSNHKKCTTEHIVSLPIVVKNFLKKYNKTEKVCKKTKQLINQYIAPNKDLKVVSYKMGFKKINT